jgi:hypothetical protein
VSDVADYQTLDSRYDDFLFSEVGEQENGMSMSMVSALARLGLDPWEEARRLAALPVDSAIAAVTALIARVPDLIYRGSNSPELAARLVPLLARSAPPQRERRPVAPLAWRQILARIDRRWLIALIAVGAVIAVSRMLS